MLLRFTASSLLFCFAAFVANARADETGDEFFEKKVRPILVARCFDCHSGTKSSGGLSLASKAAWQKGGESGEVIAPGKPEESLLIAAIEYRSLEMPPPDKGGKLSDVEIAILREWITKGAPDPRVEGAKIGGMNLDQAKSWWAFQPLSNVKDKPATPAAIDQMLDARLAAAGLTANPEASKSTVIRRATYDLTGLPPTPEEVKAFIQDDSPDAFTQLIDRLLESPQYGVQWGRHWLDVVRYADTAGENTDRPLVHAWRYRNFVFDAFNRDLPFDEFVRLQVAGDVLKKDAESKTRAEGVVATGYLAIARRFGHDIDKDAHLMQEDVIDNLGKNFLGLTIGCARCHDHKFDPISARDYYALYGIFDSTRFAFPGCEAKGQPRDMVSLLSPAETEALLAPWKAKVEARTKEEQRRQEIAAQFRLKEAAKGASHVLAKATVGEGASVPIAAEVQSAVRVKMRAGEVLHLSVSPNGNYGADSTLIEWSMALLDPTSGKESRRWSVSDLVQSLTQSNPQTKDDALWCFLDGGDGDFFLATKKQGIDGHPELSAWAAGDTPSVFVNAGAAPVQAWTSLPSGGFFVHPGPNRPVAIAWVAPIDGEYAITGRVADAHPANLDGVSFTLSHIAEPSFGAGLTKLGELNATPLPDPGPAPPIPAAYAVVEATPHNIKLHERGDPEKLGDEIPRGFPEILGGEQVTQGSGRAELAEWLTNHPLLARVMVNRIWQQHFGAGLVRTPNDFGSRGELPTHPELLDWLAAQFKASGYRVKAMHRLIMNTRAWRRASSTSAEAKEKDPGNRLLGRYSRRRLSAEELRDSLLAASGQLDTTLGEAHPFPPEATWTFTQHAPFNANYETNRRSAFLMVQRQRQHPFLALFDGADPNASTPQRQVTTAPTQALFFLNDPFFHQQAAFVAERALKETTDSSRIGSLYRQLFQRVPSQSELDRALVLLRDGEGSLEEKHQSLARILLASNEFIYVD